MNLVIDKLVGILSIQPHPVLSDNRIGPKKPSIGSDIPAITISVSIKEFRSSGIGRFVRSGDKIVQSSGIFEASVASDAFSTDLKSLRIRPLPLKKNPASIEKNFTEQDVQVRNVTDPSYPINYLMLDEPAQKNEFNLDVSKARILFGKAQTEGEKLEVIHWTVKWRDEILGNRYSGSVFLDIWTNSFERIDEISRKIQEKLRVNIATLRQKGFLKLQPQKLEAAENALHHPSVGSPFSVWKQKLGYSFVFEAEEGGDLSSGIPIKQIDVDMNGHLVESFSIPEST